MNSKDIAKSAGIDREDLEQFLRQSPKYRPFSESFIIPNSYEEWEIVADYVQWKQKEDAVMKADAAGKREEEKRKMNILYDLDGVLGRHLAVYNDRVVITVKMTLGSFFSGSATDGEKTIYFCDCVGIQFKLPGFKLPGSRWGGFECGHLQFETSSGMMKNKEDNFLNENTFIWGDASQQANERMQEVADYCKARIAECKAASRAPAQAQVSPADELKKFKELLDMGAITQEEYDLKKKQILGI